MNDRIEVKKKKTGAGETPAHTIQEGSVAAFIWRRQSPSGFAYFDYEIKRTFRSLSSGSAGTSRNFFARNQHDLVKAIAQATKWISEQEQHGLSTPPIAA